MHTYMCIHIFILHTVIGIRELTADLDSEATHWKDLGLELDVNVNNIENAATAPVCFRQTLEAWLTSGTATPGAVIEALRSPAIQHNVLATKLDTEGTQLSF